MNYYEQKKEAQYQIDQMYLDGVTTERILYKISSDFGFGKKIVSDRIKILQDLGVKPSKKKKGKKK